MSFQPFGFAVDLITPLPLDEAKIAIRKKKKSWFAIGSGARGWIIGPLLCLWWSPINDQGPMLIGWLSEEGFSTRIRGRAGSDLNGMLLLVLLYPALAWFFVMVAQNGGLSLGQWLVIGFGLIMAPLALWWAHKDRHNADVLVNFLKKNLNATPNPKPSKLE